MLSTLGTHMFLPPSAKARETPFALLASARFFFIAFVVVSNFRLYIHINIYFFGKSKSMTEAQLAISQHSTVGRVVSIMI